MKSEKFLVNFLSSPFGFIIILFSSSLVFFSFLFPPDPLTTEVIFECPSPNNKHIATFYRIYGGGAAGAQYLFVNLRKSSENFTSGDDFFEMAHGYDLRITWLNNDNIQIDYPSDADKRYITEEAVSDHKTFKIHYIDRPTEKYKFISPLKGGCYNQLSNEKT